MKEWASGYAVDLSYTNDFNYYLSPVYLNFALNGMGWMPPDFSGGANFCELACGHGISTCVLAAANPEIRFWGVDFNPSHIVSARRIAAAAALANVTFLDNSFAEIAAVPSEAFPRFDYIVMHGVYSWISEANRRAVTTFIERFLEPGGIVFVSYTCMPGWLGRSALQRLFREHARRHPHRPERQAEAAVAFLNRLAEGNAAFFRRHPRLGQHVASLRGRSANYLVHEYLSEHGCPMYHMDVAREMAAARLDYAGSAALTKNMDVWGVHPELLPLLDEARDDAWRETVKDFATDNMHRSDIYVRGPRRLTAMEREQWASRTRVALLYDPVTIPIDFSTPLGTAKGRRELYDPLLATLADRPHTIEELNALPQLADYPAGAVLDAITILVHHGYLHPMPCSNPAPNSAGALNRAIVDRVLLGESHWAMAVADIGSGVDMTPVELVGLAAHLEDSHAEPQAVRARAIDLLAEKHRNDAASGPSPEDSQRTADSEKLDKFLQTRLPLLAALGIDR